MTPRELRAVLALLRSGGGRGVPTVTMAEVAAMTPAEKVLAYRQVVCGQLDVGAPKELPPLYLPADAGPLERYRALVRAVEQARRCP